MVSAIIPIVNVVGVGDDPEIRIIFSILVGILIVLTSLIQLLKSHETWVIYREPLIHCWEKNICSKIMLGCIPHSQRISVRQHLLKEWKILFHKKAQSIFQSTAKKSRVNNNYYPNWNNQSSYNSDHISTLLRMFDHGERYC